MDLLDSQLASVTMRKTLFLCLVAAGLLPLLFLGCGGESAESRMRKMAQAQGDLNKEKDAKIAAMSGGSSPDNAAAGGAGLPKSTQGGIPSAAKLTGASANQHVSPAAIAAPSKPLSATATVEERRARTIENMAKIGRALNAYADGYAGYPVTKVPGTATNPPMSWRVAILPLLGYEKLFQQYRPTEPWDSSANKLVLARIPPEYQSPERRDIKTNYLVPLGIEAAFGSGRRLNAGMFDDGPEYTLILVEVDEAHAIEWTRPDDLVVQAAPGTFIRSKLGSLRGDGFFAVLANGRVCRIKPDANELALKALFTIGASDTEQIRDAIQDATAVPVPTPAPAATATANVDAPSETTDPPAVGSDLATTSPALPPGKPIPLTPVEEPAASPPLVLKRLPVPSESELVATRAALKELYAQDYKDATTMQDRRQLAQKLVTNSREMGEDHAARFELLRISRDLSAQNGDLTEALKTLVQMEQRFEINGPAMRLETLKLFQKSPDALVENKELVTQAKKLVAEAIHLDQYELAEEALKIGKGAAKREGDTELLAKAGRTQLWLEAAKRFYADVRQAESHLETNPSDPLSNQIVGIYTCLVKGGWDLGLPQLAKATDLKLRFLAKLDLTTSKSPREVYDLANQYWELAEQRPNLEEQGLKLRAAYWYSQATTQLPDGLEKIKARKRLAAIIETYGREETEKATSRRDIAAAAGIGEASEE
jgi:Protein of unknown function (DUF1559)